MMTRDYLRELMTIIFVRKTIILTITLGALTVAIAVLVFSERIYEAEGRVMLKGGQMVQDPTGVRESRASIESISEEDLYTEMEIFSSRSVFYEAARRLRARGEVGLADASDEELNRFISRVRNGFSASPIPRSNVIRTKLAWNDSEASERILQTLFDAYLAHRKDVYTPQGSEQFFGQQVEMFRDRMMEQEAKLLEQVGGMRADAIQMRISAKIQLMGNLERSLSEHERDRIARQRMASFAEQLVVNHSSGFYSALDSAPVSQFARHVKDFTAAQSQLLQTYKGETSRVAAVDEQLGHLRQLLQVEAISVTERQKIELESVEQQIASIRETIDGLQARIVQLNEHAVLARQIEREIDISEQSLRTFQRRYQEARIRGQEESDLFSVGIVSSPYASRQPIFPRANRVLPIGLMIGLLLGITVGFLIETFDHRFKRPEEFSTYADLPHLFSIPVYPR